MSEDTKTPLEKFSDDLDTLVQKFMDKPTDDRPSVAEYIGALHFKAHTLMHNATENAR